MTMLALLLAAAPVPDPAETVRAYYAAVQARRYAAAYLFWNDRGRASGKTRAAFARGFAHTASSRVTVSGRIQVEGAAGSSYATVPVRVDARLDTNARQRFVGSYTLRRVNDVPGSTAEQRRWHIVSARLRPA